MIASKPWQLPALLLLVSCAQAPATVETGFQFDVPETWLKSARLGTGQPTSSGEIAPDWWNNFDVPELDEFVVEALGASPTLLSAAERIAAADARARIAGAPALPRANLGLNGNRSQIQFSGPIGDLTALRRTLYGSSLSLDWEIDLWGRVRAGHRAALADFEQELCLFGGARLSLVAQVSRAYFTLVENRRQFALATAELESARQILDRTRARYRRGLGDALDVQLAEADVNRVRSQRLARSRLVDTGVRQLEVLLGRYPAGNLEVGDALPQLDGAVPAGLPSELLLRRPDLAAAERGLAAALERGTAAKLDRLPRLALTASAGTTSEKLSDLLDGDFGIWSLLANLSAPLIDGGARRAEADRTAAAGRQATQDYVALVLSAFAQVEHGLSSEIALGEEVGFLQRATTSSRSSATLTEERYFAGLTDIFSLLDARRRLYSQQRTEIATQRDLLLNRVDLYVALGGGFSAESSSSEQDQP